MLNTKFLGNQTTGSRVFSSPEPKAFIFTHCPASVRRPQFQTSSSLKPLGRSKPNFMWITLLGNVIESLFAAFWSHDQDGHHTHI